MIYPKFLKQGNCIGVPAPSTGIFEKLDIVRYKNSKKQFEDMGYTVKLSKNIFSSIRGRSAPAAERAEELNKMFEDREIDGILCATGGEFLVETLTYVDFEKLAKNPKWIEGFSDPTGILFPLTTKYDIATIYGNNFKNFGAKEYDRSLKENLEIITGNLITQKNYDMYEEERTKKITGLEGYNLTSKVEWKSLDNKPTTVRGRIIAGCLDLILELAGTKYDGTKQFIEKYKQDGIIWAFDNCELSKEELIRSLWKLNELGYFKHTKAIIFGRCGTDISYLGYDMETCLNDSILAGLNIPIIYDADISHKGPSMTIINGAIATIKYSSGKGEISFELC